MERRFYLILLTIISFCFVKINAEEVSQQQAFEIVSKLFEGQGVDYYTITAKDNSDIDKWMFFIDMIPSALWSHPCYVVKYPKTGHVQEDAFEKAQYSFPPEEYEYTPYQINSTHNEDLDPNFIIAEPVPSRGNSEQNANEAKRTYALIVGGATITGTEEKDTFDHDCKFFYQTLVKTYKVPKNNVYTLLHQAVYGNSTDLKDLDGDYIGDVNDRSTLVNIQNYIDSLNVKLNPNDNLFIFISSHGHEPTSNGCGLYINNQYLYADKFMQWLNPILDNHVNVTVILGACYSKYFANRLNHPYCVALASSDGLAIGIKDGLNYFPFYITHALNGKNILGSDYVDADYNKDSYISILEAFEYAYNNLDGVALANKDGKTVYMHPYLTPNQEDLAGMIAVNRVPSVLKISTAPNDKLLTDGIYWNSPDIWLRRNADGKEDHQYIPLQGNNRAWVNVRITNDGSKYDSGKTLRLYWAQATSMINSYLFNGNGTYYDTEPFGGHLADIKLTDISPNSSKVYSTCLNIPDELSKSTTLPEFHQYTIYAAIVDDNNLDKDPSLDINKFSGTAQSTYTIIEQTDTVRSTAMFFYNPVDEEKSYKLKFHWRDENSKNLFKHANVTVDMSPTVYRAWERGRNCTRAVASSDYSPYATEMTEDFSEYSKIIMSPYGIGRISFIFNFYDATGTRENYTFDIVQTDDNDNILGGQTINLTPPQKSFEAIPIDSLIWGGGIGTINPDPDFPFLPTWYNSKNQKVSTGRTLQLKPENCNDTYRIVAITPEGELMDNEVRVSVDFGIKYISYDESFSNGINIIMHETPVSGYNLTLTSIANGNIIYSKELSMDEKDINIPTYYLQSGVYLLTCTLNGEVIDTYKFSK